MNNTNSIEGDQPVKIESEETKEAKQQIVGALSLAPSDDQSAVIN